MYFAGSAVDTVRTVRLISNQTLVRQIHLHLRHSHSIIIIIKIIIIINNTYYYF